MSDEKLIQISFSIYSAPGSYAILLGSGVSRAAGIKSGWEITVDLIRQIALSLREPEQEDYEKWYRDKYKIEPTYPNVIEKLGGTNAERCNLLAKYFEPTEEELNEGKKVPTKAHCAIADLVKLGFIKVIITTNFDQLMETALREKGITPTIIDSEDSIIGATPYTHNKCTLIKVNGDYKDNRIKNTPDELLNYSSEMNHYLDRIFDDFGLITCGWSGEWDVALRNSLIRRSNRRYSIHYCARLNPEGPIGEFIVKIGADVVRIKDADEFFYDISEKVNGLISINKKSPLSYQLAIEETKHYLSEERHYIKLHDFSKKVVEEAHNILSSDQFQTDVPKMDILDYQKRMKQYEEIVRIPIGVATTIALFDRGSNQKKVLDALNRFSQIRRFNGYEHQIHLQLYPALLFFYSTSLASLESSNFDMLFQLMNKSEYRDLREKQPGISVLNYAYVFYNNSSQYIDLPNAKNQKTAVSDYLLIKVKEYLKSQIPDLDHLEELFDVFEYLYGMVYIDKNFEDLTKESIWAPVGRYVWKYHGWDASKLNPIKEYFDSGELLGDDWDLLKKGFFGGSASRLKECRDALEKHINQVNRSMPWKGLQ